MLFLEPGNPSLPHPTGFQKLEVLQTILVWKTDDAPRMTHLWTPRTLGQREQEDRRPRGPSPEAIGLPSQWRLPEAHPLTGVQLAPETQFPALLPGTRRKEVGAEQKEQLSWGRDLLKGAEVGPIFSPLPWLNPKRRLESSPGPGLGSLATRSTVPRTPRPSYPLPRIPAFSDTFNIVLNNSEVSGWLVTLIRMPLVFS